MLFIRKIQIYYRRNLEEYRWLLIGKFLFNNAVSVADDCKLGNLVAFLLLLLSIALPAWTVRQNSDSTIEYYGVIWSLSRSNFSFNVYKIHAFCDGTMKDVMLQNQSGKNNTVLALYLRWERRTISSLHKG
jgi:hypothetical protein